MKKIKNGVFTFITVVVVQFSALAQDPDPGDFGGGDPNPTDTPIDTYLWVLLIVSLCYVFYKYRSLKSKESTVS